jgi:hypothetical protein
VSIHSSSRFNDQLRALREDFRFLAATVKTTLVDAVATITNKSPHKIILPPEKETTPLQPTLNFEQTLADLERRIGRVALIQFDSLMKLLASRKRIHVLSAAKT